MLPSLRSCPHGRPQPIVQQAEVLADAPRLSLPLYVVFGTADRVASIAQAKKVFAAARPDEQRKFISAFIKKLSRDITQKRKAAVAEAPDAEATAPAAAAAGDEETITVPRRTP